MKHYFWFGLFVGCLSSLLAMGIAGAFVTAAAQSKSSNPEIELQSPPGSGAVKEGPQGGGGAGPVNTMFSYQGLLKKNGAPVNGACDLRFKLYDTTVAYGSNQVGPTLNAPNTPVTNGVFTVYLDFGNQFNGQGRYLETLVSCPTSASPSFTTLPRQYLSAAPYALSLRPGATISSSITMPVLSINAYSPGNALSVIDDLGDAGSATIFARANLGTAVNGYAAALSGFTVGVYGITNSKDGYGMIAQGNGGTALAISGGNIKVFNAGIGSETPVFIHKVNKSASGNKCNIQDYATVINNSLINGNPNAMLIVTPNYGPNNAGIPPAWGIPGVYYDATNQCGKGAGRWVIYNIDTVSLTDNSMFNVMVVVP